jgi:aminoglycoside N3'-acetyltransferase/NAD(P)-dependent dehydrogenase (short-subunit alcohol dehydrogenase family)
VVSGPTAAVEALQNGLTDQGVSCLRVHTFHGFHSAMMDPILEPFTEHVQAVNLESPNIPYLSNVTGTWITAADATSPSYWARHLRHTVRFAAGLGELLQDPERILLEVGPGRTLSTLAMQHSDKAPRQVVLSSLRHPQDYESDVAFLLNTLGQLWLAGIPVDWSGFYAGERRQRLPLLTYPFERQRYWVESPKRKYDVKTPQQSLRKEPDIADWFYVPSWKQSVPPKFFAQGDLADQQLCWLVLSDDCGVGAQLIERLAQQGQDVITVRAGAQFARTGEHLYEINPRAPEHYHALLKTLRAMDKSPDKIVHVWSVTSTDSRPSGSELFESYQDLGFYSLLFLAQALGEQTVERPVHLGVISNHLQCVTEEEILCPEKATVLGPCKVIPQEYPNLVCRSIDIVVPPPGSDAQERLIHHLIAELTTNRLDAVVAYRGNQRWVQTFEAVRLDAKARHTIRLREGGVYLITGGLGRMGLVLAEYLARTVRAKLILIGRSAFPERDEWNQWLATHGEENRVTGMIRKLQALEELGADVLIVSADVASEERMQAVVMQAYGRFGTLHGVIHSAGIIGEQSKRAISETDYIEYEKQTRAKVHGLYILARVLQGVELDFCILQSSLSSILGGLAFSAYAGANLFMDAFAHKYHRANCVPWISINRDAWRSGEEKASNLAMGTTLAQLAITPEEGMEAFQRVLSLDPLPQIVVSTGDLQTRIDQWIKLESLRDHEYSTTIATSVAHIRPHLQNAYVPPNKLDRNALLQPRGGRPELESSFVAPHDAFERQLIHIWEDLLGWKPIGVQDDFFELGGDSLLAVRLFAQIEKQMGSRLPLVTLFERPTIAHLADCLRRQREEASDALPFEMPREHVVSDRIRHPIARYLPSKYHPYVRRTYRRLKHSSMARALRGLYVRHGKNIAQRFFSYTPTQLENQLKIMGITAGDTLLMHSAFRVFNGFEGTPEQVIACVLNVIGESGNLVMVSMPYGGSTAAYLRAGVPFDVRHTRSAMGVITEIFRHTPGVVRSINPAHPILAWGPAAPWLIADHEHTRYSCGKGSPFEKLVHVQAKALLFDVSLRRSMTFLHYVKDQFQDTLPVKLYEEMPVESIVIDTSGRKKVVKSYVFSSESRRYRSQNLQQALIQEKVVKTETIGNTKLIVLQLPQVVECAQHMVRAGKPLWKESV